MLFRTNVAGDTWTNNLIYGDTCSTTVTKPATGVKFYGTTGC
jgi:hypothetical protein